MQEISLETIVVGFLVTSALGGGYWSISRKLDQLRAILDKIHIQLVRNGAVIQGMGKGD